MRLKYGLLSSVCGMLAAASLAAACSVRSFPPADTSASAAQPSAAAQQELLAELDALQAPAGADAAAFAQLKAEFRQLLLSGGLRHKAADKAASAGLGVTVDDLNVADNGGGNLTLTWTYRHQGDYDQNGEVNVSDLSPIGLYFLQNSGSAVWQMARVADGDGNTEVNVADLTPLGQNFGSLVTGYRIESTATPADAGSWSAVTEVGLAAGEFIMGNPFRHFTAQLNGQAAGLSYRAVALWSGTIPAPSFDEVENNDSVAGAQALSGGVSGFTGSLGTGAGYSAYDGDAGDYFSFAAAADDELDITLALNSGTGDLDLYLLNSAGVEQLNSEGTGNLERIQAVINSGGTFIIYCACYSGYSDYTLGLSITGSGANQPPDAVLGGSPLTGESPLLVNWDAGGSSDPDGSIVRYEWDWEDDGVWDYDSGATPTVQCTYTGAGLTWTTRVRVTDNEGLADTSTRQVQTNGGGGFTEPPVETFVDYSQPGDTNARKWLLNCYRPLPPWQDADRAFQTDALRQWADQVLQLTNQERANNGGLAPLAFDPHLELVAQAHARDMALENFFEHENLYYMSPYDRLDAVNRPAYGIGSNVSSENIFAGRQDPAPFAGTPQLAMDSWMNSAGHRANILNPEATHLGVGVYYLTGDSNHYYAYFVQVFTRWAADPGSHDWLEPQEVPAP